MKTKKLFRARVNLKIFMVLPVIAFGVISFSSCGQNKNSGQVQTEILPPPPPPPPPLSPPPPPVPGQKVDDAYINVDEMPVFPGGDEALLRFISENIIYPEQAKADNIQGKVTVSFKIKADGTVSDASILKSVDPLLDMESLRILSLLPKFTPGKLNGVPVPVWYRLPISFKLN